MRNKALSCILLAVSIFTSFEPQIALAQQAPVAAVDDAMMEMQKLDPQAAQAFSKALQTGDLETAKKIYEELKQAKEKAGYKGGSDVDPRITEELNRAIKKGDLRTAQSFSLKIERARRKKPWGMITLEDLAVEEEKSLFERTLSGDFPSDILKEDLKQFGYGLFQKETMSTMPAANIPVGPDYLIGPGDQFTITLWGTAEGIFNLTVAKEGTVTLPKVGVVPVAGVRFGELENTLRRHLSKYYTNFNISIAMGKLKTITIYLVGEVSNPGSYSVSSLTTVYGALVSAGGPTKKGSLRTLQVLRSGRIIKVLDLYDFLLRGDRSQDIKLQHEDTVFVPLIGPIVGIAGSVYRPAIYEFRGKETVADALQISGGVMPIGLGKRLQIIRFADHDKKIVKDVNISGNSVDDFKENPVLMEKIANMDVIKVYPIYDKTWETVNLDGDVRNAGDYQWKEGLKLKEIIERGQILPTADKRNAEIIRLTGDFMDRKIIPVDLEALSNGDDSQNILLQPKDKILVYTTFREVEKVRIKGEVVRPGEYEIYRGEKLSDFLKRVGGFTQEAYPYGAILKRRDVKNAQAKNMQSFISRMQSQVLQSAAGGAATAVSIEEAGFAKSELQLNQSLLENLKSMQEQMEGRVAINITKEIEAWAGSKEDLVLQDGDSLLIPKRPQEVLVMGEVHSPGAQIYIPGLRVGDYLNQSGGLTNYSDRSQVFVVQANGFAFSSDSPSISNIEKVKLNPGDTILVPQKVERYAAMRFTKDIIDILFKTAVTIATLTVIF